LKNVLKEVGLVESSTLCQFNNIPENLFLANTHKDVLARVSEKPLAHADVRLGQKVIAIENDVLESLEGSTPISVSTSTGECYQFDEVVVTIPLGWLKKNMQAFSPPMPARFLKAIDSVGYGCLEKVYITFPRAFWAGPPSEPEPKSDLGFMQWISPEYALGTNPSRWNQEAVSLAALLSSVAHPTLLFYIFGEQSRVLVPAVTSCPTQDERNKILREFFEPYYALLPHYLPTSSDCIPISFLATTWLTDEFAGNGSYCNFQVGVTEGDKHIEVIREGCPERNLWFAGEHTAPFVALGTTTGAYWSGESVGTRIIKAYGLGVDHQDS